MQLLCTVPPFRPFVYIYLICSGSEITKPSEHSWILAKLHWKTIWHLFPNDFFVYHVTKKCYIAIGRFNLAGNSTSLPRFRFISHSAVYGVQTQFGLERTQSLHGFSHSRLENRDLLNATLNISILWEIYISYFSFSLNKYFFGGNVFVCVWKQCQPGGCRKPWTKACKASKCRSDRKKCTKKGGSWEYIEQYSGPAF